MNARWCVWSHLSVCQSVCITFESLDLGSSFLVCSYICRIFRSKFVYQGHRVKVEVTWEQKSVKPRPACAHSVTVMAQSRCMCSVCKSISMIQGMTVACKPCERCWLACAEFKFPQRRQPVTDRITTERTRTCILVGGRTPVRGCLSSIERHHVLSLYMK